MMKNTITPFLILLAIFSLSSCASKNFYQVHKASPINGKITESAVLFENKHCIVSYDLMNMGGNSGFYFYNKTNDFITIQLDKTFFIRNGESFPYFKNRSTSYSYSRAASASIGGVYSNGMSSNPAVIGGQSASGVETNYPQIQQMIIPPLTKMRVQEYAITEWKYQDCEYNVYPSRKEVQTLKFSEADSPLEFSNLITYTSGGETINYENQFFVEEITNYPEAEATILIRKDDCGNSLYAPLKSMRFSGPNYFYLSYGRAFK
jgi:hypothetical protein